MVTLPEQYFGGSRVTLLHEPSGVRIEFDARDAVAAIGVDPSPPLHVRAASTWLDTHRQEVEANHAKVLEYDWTFTTGYRGTTTVDGAPVPPADCQVPGGASGAQQEASGSVGGASGARGGADEPAVASPLLRWTSPAPAFDRSLLLARDPILLFASVPIYESELEDNGVASASVRLRVMPRCFLLLFRFYLRVDGVAVRLRETRVYSPFGAGTGPAVVTRETTHYEGTYEQLRASGVPCTPSALSDGDAAAAALSAASPSCMRRYVIERLVLAPKAQQAS